MNQQHHAFCEPLANEAGQQFARLSNALELAERIAGMEGRSRDAALDESARISGAYDSASPVARRRFDTLAAEIASWAGAGLDALALAADPAKPPKAAAGRLAEELDIALGEMNRLLRL